MPELPEVETVVRALAKHLTGRRFSRIEVLHRPAIQGSPQPPACIRGQRVERVYRRGKFIRLDLEDGLGVAIHLRMTGWLGIRSWPPHGKPDSHVRIRVCLDEGAHCLLFRDMRTFGRFWCGTREALENTPALRLLGPEPLEIDAATFARRLRARSGALKALLLNQRFLAGLGNIYVDEALFAARLHPLRPASSVTPPQARRLHHEIQRLLRASIRAGGTTVDNFLHPDGNTGWFQRQLLAYGRQGKPCARCQTLIKRVVTGQRGTWFCPKCQRLKPAALPPRNLKAATKRQERPGSRTNRA